MPMNFTDCTTSQPVPPSVGPSLIEPHPWLIFTSCGDVTIRNVYSLRIARADRFVIACAMQKGCMLHIGVSIYKDCSCLKGLVN